MGTDYLICHKNICDVIKDAEMGRLSWINQMGPSVEADRTEAAKGSQP